MASSDRATLRRAVFGTVLGIKHGVEVYSCNYKSVLSAGTSHWGFHHRHAGHFTGVRYQCVELARRYLIATRGITFESIPMAYDIFDLPHARRIEDGAPHKWSSCRNGTSSAPPRVGSLLIWEPRGYFKTTGHVAVVTDVQPSYVDIIEQNVHDAVWDAALGCSRRLPISSVASDSGGRGSSVYRISDTFHDTRILGWVNVD